MLWLDLRNWAMGAFELSVVLNLVKVVENSFSDLFNNADFRSDNRSYVLN